MTAEPARDLSPRLRDTILIAVSAMACALFILYSWGVGGVRGFPLDDAWIYQTYARNLAQSGQWAFIPGLPSTGSTSLLYVPLLAPGFLVAGFSFWWTHVIGWLSLSSLALVGARLFPRLSVRQSLFVGLALALSWHAVWAAVSGMETALFSALILAFWLYFFRSLEGEASYSPKRGLLLGLWAGVLLLGRPEGVLAVAVAGLYQLLLRGPSIRVRLRWAFFTALGFALVLLPFFWFNWHVSGAIFPNTFYAKQAEYAPLWEQPYLLRFWQQAQVAFSGAQILVLPGIILLIARVFHKKEPAFLLLPLAWVALHWALYAARLPVTYQHGRYAIPTMAPLVALGVYGLLASVRFDAPSFLSRVLGRAWALTAVVAYPLVLVVLGAPAYARDVAFIEHEMVPAARYLADNTSPDAVIAAHDIGALGFFAPRPLRDMAGLISPEVIPVIDDPEGLLEFITSGGADYLVIFPGWSPAYRDLVELGGFCPLWQSSSEPGYQPNESGLGPLTIYQRCDG